MLGFLRAYLGWSIETYYSKLSNVLIIFYRNVAILCSKISSVYRAIGPKSNIS